ncbi:chloride channel protein [Streptomyces sp. NPDC002039]|uniref:chloride channel protein n=1 Tax=Streptomyces sp. NPDC002039 TaxID=3154660 RepID=UPI00332EFB8E
MRPSGRSLTDATDPTDLPVPRLALLPAFLLFEAATGVLGAAYNRLVIGLPDLCDHVTRVGPVARAAAIGAVVGLLLGIVPEPAGGGDRLSGRLLGGRLLGGDIPLIPVLAGYLVVRFLAGPLSYAARTPGGLFAPLPAVGALWGVLVHALAPPLLPGGAAGAVPFAIVGMAALFASVVRAPVTGIVLVVEMTGATSPLIPLMTACFAATPTPDRMGSTPIHDSLRPRTVWRD